MADHDEKHLTFAARWGEEMVRWRWLVLAACLLAMAGAAAGARHLTFSNDYRAFFGETNPQLTAFDALQDVYTKNDNILFVVAPADGKVFSPETLDTIEKLTKAAWKIPYSRRVDSISNFQYTRAEGDELIVADLVKGAAGTAQAELDQRRDEALAEPLLRYRLIPPKADVTGVNVTLQLDEKNPDAIVEAVAEARRLVAKFEAKQPGLKIHLTGIGMLSIAFSEQSLVDMNTLMPIMFGVLLLSMGLLLRSVSGTVGVLAVIGASVATAMGIAGYMGIALTPPSAVAPTIIMTLAVADSIHFLVTMFTHMRQGHSREAAIVESLRVNMQPIFLTSLTTAIGFLSMNSSDAPPFADLGNITAIGVVAAFFFSVLLLPALMAVLPVRVKPRARTRRMAMDRLADFVVRRQTPLFWGMSLVTILMFAFIPRIDLNDRFVDYFDERVDFRVATDFAAENLTGMYQMEFSIPAGASAGINRPQYMASLGQFTDWLRGQPEVVHVNSLSDTMKRLNRSLHGDDPEWYRLPDEKALAAQYLLLYEMSLPFGLDLNDQINVDKSATRLSVTLHDISTREMRGFEDKANAWIVENLPPEMHNRATGGALMFAHISGRNINSMLKGTAIALVLISVILVVALRSLRIGLISLIPNLVPAGIAFGLWGLMVSRVDVGVSIVAALTIGIVVDDTIHFLSKYLRARRERKESPAESVRYAFSTVGVALLVTTTVLVAGFLVLAQSSFAINANMGLLTAITIAVALIADFLLLPPILMKFEETKDDVKVLAPAE